MKRQHKIIIIIITINMLIAMPLINIYADEGNNQNYISSYNYAQLPLTEQYFYYYNNSYSHYILYDDNITQNIYPNVKNQIFRYGNPSTSLSGYYYDDFGDSGNTSANNNAPVESYNISANRLTYYTHTIPSRLSSSNKLKRIYYSIAQQFLIRPDDYNYNHNYGYIDTFGGFDTYLTSLTNGIDYSFIGTITFKIPQTFDNSNEVLWLDATYTWSQPTVIMPNFKAYIELNEIEYDDTQPIIVTQYEYNLEFNNPIDGTGIYLSRIKYMTQINPQDMTAYLRDSQIVDPDNPDNPSDNNGGSSTGGSWMEGYQAGKQDGMTQQGAVNAQQLAQARQEGYLEGQGDPETMTGWLSTAISNFFGINLFYVGGLGFSLGAVFSAMFALSLVIIFLKIFAGG